MKLNFDPNQDYQLQAIRAVTDIFEGQPLGQSDFELTDLQGSTLFTENGVGNNLVLTEDQVLENLQKIQERNGLKRNEKLDGLNFSVEMETGTGKTYVYLRTIYELNRLYGFKKFVIVVPSIAIREGVLKNLEITHEHFQGLYEKVPATFKIYDSKKVSDLRGFSTNNSIQILVINIDSFAKDENIINKPNDKLTGKRPIEFIKYTRPIVIVDEPQNMETEIRKKAIEELEPTCTLRYSATHIRLYNLVYSLDPVKAYDLGLVKQIEVDSVVSEDAYNEAFVKLENLKASKTKVQAKIVIDVNEDSGVSRKSFTISVGDDLYELSKHRDLYKNNFIVDEIDVENEYITLANGTVLYKGQSRGGLTDEIMKIQMQKTVEEHLLKEQKYREKGIKVLSLFFIDRVANYRSYDNNGNPIPGKFATWFEEVFKELSQKTHLKGLLDFPIDKLHNGYFAQDKKGRFKDSREGHANQDDDETYQLIMKDKERLLDPKEPLRFIFSHSALREGWDSPNVFQICTLNETKSELKKRQEIGRGLRLAVDQTGNRTFDKNINRLTVVANESYEDFAKQLQKEIEDECGVDFKDRIKNKRDRIKITYRKGFQLDPLFLDIWNRIKYQTTYRVEYDTKTLIEQAAKAIKDLPETKPSKIRSTQTHVVIQKDGVSGVIKKDKTTPVEARSFEIPDILGYIPNKTELTRSTTLEILQATGRLNEVLANPQLFLDSVIKTIKSVMSELMIEGIKYEKIGDQEYKMRLFETHELESYIDRLAFRVQDSQKTIYSDLIPLDSDTEMKFAKDCETREDIEFYFKLPFWFKIKTPIGDYNPDWALIFKNDKRIYFVAETKSTLDLSKLREAEKLKIRCGKAHFDEFRDVEFRHVTSVSELT